MLNSLFVNLTKALPTRLISYVFGIIAKLPLPGFFRESVYLLYSRLSGVNLEEVELPLSAYPTLSRFFVRNLKAGLRPIQGQLILPCDSFLRDGGTIEQDKLLQIKGREYSLQQLLPTVEGLDLGKRFENGAYLTLYLAPKDYHQVHSPVSGKILGFSHIPGRLFPVNDWSVRNFTCLFGRNERVCIYLQSEFGLIALIMVGALNVGSISLAFKRYVSNSLLQAINPAASIHAEQFSPALDISVGDRLGSFNLGSTVILLFEAGRLDFPKELLGQSVKLGQALRGSILPGTKK